MSYIGAPDFDRPIPFAAGHLYHPYGGGAFQLAPSRCLVTTANDGRVELQLDLIRALDTRQSRASLACTVGADYAGDAALAHVRTIAASSSLTACVLRDWWLRVLPSATLGAPVELTQPTILASNGLGTARVIASLTLETGLILESMLTTGAKLEGVAEACVDGVSPRLPVVVRFSSSELLAELLALTDAADALPRRVLVDYFTRDLATLPLHVDGDIDAATRARFAEAMADRIVSRFGRFVPSQTITDAPVVQLDAASSNGSLRWALAQPFLASRRIVLPVDLLSAAQDQIDKLGPESVIRRTTLTALPSFGQTRVTALCNLPTSRVGVDALGVTLTFPPHPPARPQPQVATALFDAADDISTVDVRLSPGEPLSYRYAPFAVLTDERGTRQIDAAEVAGDASLLHLSTEQFPIDFAVIEVTPALGALAIVSGLCTYEVDGVRHEQPFTLDSGHLATSIAIPRQRSTLTVEGEAIARDGSGRLPIGPLETPHVRLDVTAFPGYGPQHVDIRCVFDDSATIQAVSLLPMDRDDVPEHVASLSFTPDEPSRTFSWTSRSPFASGLRYRAFNAVAGTWTDVPAGSSLVVSSSQLRAQERRRESIARRETDTAAPEAAIEPVGSTTAYDATDALLYDRIDNPAKKLYVPRYGLDVQTVSGQDRYRLAMTQRNATSTLELYLVATPPASLGDQARDAQEYPHRLVVFLDFLVAASSGARKALEFTEVSRTGAIVTASLTFATLAERDDVYRALTERDRQARLLVHRIVDVRVAERPSSGGSGGGGGFLPPSGPGPRPGTHLMAVPIRPINVMMLRRVEQAPARESNTLLLTSTFANAAVLRKVGHFVPSLPTPQLVFTGKEESNGFTRCTLSVQNWADFSDDFFAAASDLPPCGRNTAASRTWVDILDADTGARLYGFCALGTAKGLNGLWFAVPAGQQMPPRVSIQLTDRRANVQRTSNAVETVVPQRSTPATRDARVVLEQVVSPAPFEFSPALHSYIFQGMTPTTGNNQLVRHRFPWKGTFYTYLQDASRPQVVYVFADQFKIARRPEPPYTPFATVRVASRPDATDADVVFDYLVAPYTNPKRLADARAQLLADPRFGEDAVEFQPFLTSDVRFFIDRPSTTGAVREQRPGASVVLQGALKDTLAMPLGDFRLLFDAMHRPTASLFLGRVEIDVPGGETESVPFTARMDDLAGEVFTYEATTDASGVVQVTARNAIESALSVQTIDATFTWSTQRVRGLVRGAALPTASLAAGATIALTVTLETPLPAAAEPELTFDLGGVKAIPNPEAIWDAILDRTTVDYFKLVTAKAIATLFEPVAGRESERIVSILLEFESGGTAELNAATLEAKVRVDYPIDDVMLGRPVSSTYRYSVTVIRADGRQDRDAAPRESGSAVFFVSVIR